MRRPLTFKEKFSSYPDEKLVEILRSKGDYLPEALKAVYDLIAERAISEEKMGAISGQLAKKESERLALAKKPLSLAEKIAFISIPFIGIVVFLIAQVTYHEQGLDKKKKESLTFTLIGAGIWILIALGLSS